MQRAIESAGISTVALSNIPDLTRAVGVPRLVAVEHPFGQIMGRPGDGEVQRAVLLEALKAGEEMKTPGEVKHLPFEWTRTAEDESFHPPEPSPIVKHLKRRPWQLPRLLNRDIPGKG